MFRDSFLVILLLFWPVHGRASSSTQIESIKAAIHNQHYDQAVSIANSALKEDPRDFRVYTLKGVALSLQGDAPAALMAFERALSLSPDYLAALKGEAQLLYQTEDKRGIPVLQKIAKENPGDQTAHEMLAIFQARQKNCDAAISQFQLVDTSIAPHPESLQWYGYCLMREKRYEEAAAKFDALVKLMPENAYARYDLALLQTMANSNEDAIQTLQPLLSAQTPDPDVLSLASQAYEVMEDTPKAVSLLRQAIVLDPGNADFYVRFAGLCLNHDSFQVGVDMVNAGLKHIPKEASMYIARGLLYDQLAQYEKAEHDFETAEQLNSAGSTSSYALALTEIQNGHSEQALAKIQAKLVDHPKDALLHFLLAKILFEQGAMKGSPKFQQALDSALLAVRLKPDLGPAHDLLAGMYLKTGQNTLAIEQCRVALQINPSDQSALYHLIMASRKDRKDAEVSTLVKRLIALQHDAGDTRKRYKLVELDQAAPK